MTLAQRGRQIPLLFALCAAGVEGAPAGAAEAPAGPAGTPLRVVRYAENVFIRSAFSPAEDLVVQVAKGRNGQANFMGTRLVPTAAGVSQADLSGGRLIHGNGDDSTPWNLNGTYIGANHGCSAGREITCAGHGKAAADLGSEWEDEKGSRFYLIKIVDKDRLWFLPANQGTGAIWRFNSTVAGAALTNKAKGATLAFTKNEMAQVLPACRMKKQEYLVEGRTPLEEGKPVSCTFFDIAEESEIINPGSLLQDLVTHPGTERPFNAGHLDAVVRDRILYRFYPNGANVITYDSKALQEFNLGYMGFIQSAKLTQGQYETHEYYIPKTLPFTQDQIRYDFRGLQDYAPRLPSPLNFGAAFKNVEDPANLPDRFIQLLGRKRDGKVEREVGFALGYSLLHGLTRPAERAKNASAAAMLYTSSKSYPTAVNQKMGVIPAGTEFSCVAYRHYFSPGAQPAATCFYWHEEQSDTLVYADYHKSVDRDVLRLPAALAGRPVTVVEKTPSLALQAEKVTPDGGVPISVAGEYGYVVLRVAAGK